MRVCLSACVWVFVFVFFYQFYFSFYVNLYFRREKPRPGNKNVDGGYSIVANSRRPLDRLQYVFALCDPVTLTFDLKQYHYRLPSLKTGLFVFSYTANKQTQKPMNALLRRLSSVWVIKREEKERDNKIQNKEEVTKLSTYSDLNFVNVNSHVPFIVQATVSSISCSVRSPYVDLAFCVAYGPHFTIIVYKLLGRVIGFL